MILQDTLVMPVDMLDVCRGICGGCGVLVDSVYSL